MHEISNRRRLYRLQRLSKLLDSQFNIAGVRFGFDALIGLVPALGDLIGGVLSFYIIRESYMMGVPKRLVLKMVFNVLGDFLVGSIPLVGDFLDIFLRANDKNVALVEQYMKEEKKNKKKVVKEKQEKKENE